jgi:hypothetical protein
MLVWSKGAATDRHFIVPGKPMQNGFIKGFNARMRDELLNETLFFDLDKPRANTLTGLLTAISAASLVGEVPHPRGLCRPPHRNRRSATHPDQHRRSSVAPPAPLGAQNPEALT